MTNQVWNINGRIYTWSQLQALKAKKLDAKTAEIVYVSPETTEEEREEIAEAHEVEVENLVVDEEVPETEGVETTEEVELPTNFLQLKKLAKELGMTVTQETKKEEILEFLNTNE